MPDKCSPPQSSFEQTASERPAFHVITDGGECAFTIRIVPGSQAPGAVQPAGGVARGSVVRAQLSPIARPRWAGIDPWRTRTPAGRKSFHRAPKLVIQIEEHTTRGAGDLRARRPS